MFMINQVIMGGNVCFELEPRQVGEKGTTTVKIRLANSKKKDETTSTSYVDVVCWNTIAEKAVENVRKGDYVVVTGQIRTGKYTYAAGEDVPTFEIVADSVLWDTHYSNK